MRRELDAQLRPYRGKMTADQLARLGKSFLDRKVYEHYGLPRLSLFYVGVDRRKAARHKNRLTDRAENAISAARETMPCRRKL